MFDNFSGISVEVLMGQVMLGLINGSFYAVLSLGLAIIFGLLGIVNFAHGALFMMGAFVAWGGINMLGLNYFAALIVAPIVVGLFGIVLEKSLIKYVYKLDHIYGFLLTMGIALVIEGVFRNFFGSAGMPFRGPDMFSGSVDLGFTVLPKYRLWVVCVSLAVCVSAWLLIEKTSLGALLRSATENPLLVQAFGVRVPRMITLTYGVGVALAAFVGVLAAPIYSVNPQMGSNLITVVFAVVVIGGMGSIMGAIVTGYLLGVLEGLTKVFFPPLAATVIFIVMAVVLLVKPAGLFGRSQ